MLLIDGGMLCHDLHINLQPSMRLCSGEVLLCENDSEKINCYLLLKVKDHSLFTPTEGCKMFG